LSVLRVRTGPEQLEKDNGQSNGLTQLHLQTAIKTLWVSVRARYVCLGNAIITVM